MFEIRIMNDMPIDDKRDICAVVGILDDKVIVCMPCGKNRFKTLQNAFSDILKDLFQKPVFTYSILDDVDILSSTPALKKLFYNAIIDLQEYYTDEELYTADVDDYYVKQMSV